MKKWGMLELDLREAHFWMLQFLAERNEQEWMNKIITQRFFLGKQQTTISRISIENSQIKVYNNLNYNKGAYFIG